MPENRYDETAYMTILMTKAKDEGGLDYNGVGRDAAESTRPLLMLPGITYP